ncbi:insulinase family protein [Flavobacteriales bacterium]|jgi:zinc protease|nr:insulinase family protein [Flavobacteriales bacterium]
MKNIKSLTTWILTIALLGYLFINNVNLDNSTNYEYETVENDPLNTLIYTLDNGLKVYMSVNTDEPRIQTNIVVNTGSKQDPSDATGLAHYLEHMLFKGTSEIGTINWEEEQILLNEISNLYEKRRDVVNEDERKNIYHQIDSISLLAAEYAVANEYDKMISSLGAKGTNAYTSLERTVYVNDIPSNEFEKWLTIESERFSELVLRLFHTELEVVYEEYNRSRDNDYWLSYETMSKYLYKKHPYGTQTTIGTSEHLKNPSMEKIHEYFNEKYVPNNMAIVLAGDLDPDRTIDLIKKYFGHYQTKDVPEFIPAVEDPIIEPQIINVRGADAEWVDIGFRLPGIDHEETYILPLMDGLLSNGQAGLIDLNLVKKQKILSGYSSYSIHKDYSQFELRAQPREGQSLDDAKILLLAELDKIKKGEFENWMLPAVIKNFKLNDLLSNEYNGSRVYKMTDAFIMKQDWSVIVNENDKLSTLTKQDIINFANKYFGDNYIVVNKLTGESNSVKVEKPEISTLPLNRDTLSSFASMFDNMKSSRLTPLFNNYQDIKENTLNSGIPFYYVKNTTNEIFSLEYILDMGAFSDQELALAVEYLEYLGTDNYTSSDIEREMFKLGLSYSVYAAEERVYVSLSGLEESLVEGIKIFEHILNNVKPDQEAYDNMVLDIIKQRKDNKLSKGYIAYGMREYAKYGDNSPFKYIIQEETFDTINVKRLADKIKSLTSFEHYVYYYGRKDLNEVSRLLNTYHKTPEVLNPLIPAKEFVELDIDSNVVFFTDYDMVQSEISMLSKVSLYNKDLIAPARVFNEYFGSGLSSIVFQEIRESKALAYSAYSYFTSPSELDESHYVRAYLGTQVDKLGEATDAILELMNNMPEVDAQFEDARVASMKKIETSRTKRSSLFWQYLYAKKMNRDYDLNKDIYPALNEMTMEELKMFFDQNVKGRDYAFTVIGNKEFVDSDVLKELGVYKELTLEDIFGY